MAIGHRYAAAALTVAFLAGCGRTSTEPAATEPTTTEPSAAPSIAPAPSERSRVVLRESDDRAFRAGRRLLEAAGVRRVARSEPAHGSASSALGGRWYGQDVFVSADPDLGRELGRRDRVIETRTVRGTTVRVVANGGGDLRLHRFTVDRYAWAVGVLTPSWGSTDVEAGWCLVDALLAAAQE